MVKGDFKVSNRTAIIGTGMVGLIAASLTGLGEFFLNYDPLARYSETSYTYMLGGSTDRETLGHFIGSLAAPLYIVGMWHIYLMLKPAHKLLAFIGFLISAYGFMVGADWLSSRSSIGALVHAQAMGLDTSSLIDLYRLRYENLLEVVRVTTLTLSVIFIILTLTGRTHYERWHAIFNPIILLLSAFGIYEVAPDLGKYVLPIALNFGFTLFFAISLVQTFFIKYED